MKGVAHIKTKRISTRLQMFAPSFRKMRATGKSSSDALQVFFVHHSVVLPAEALSIPVSKRMLWQAMD